MSERIMVFLAALVCGLMLGTINQPYNLTYIGMFGFPMAYWIAHQIGHAKTVGYGLGVGYFLLTMSWITAPFQVEKDLYGWMAYPAWGLMAVGLALFWIPIFTGHRRGAFVVAMTYAFMELLRGWIFTGFPWALFAYGFVDTSFAQSAAFIGSFGLSAALLFVVLAMFGPSRLPTRVLGMVVMIVLVLPHFYRGEPTVDKNADFKVSLVQANISQADSFDVTRAHEFLDEQIEMSQGDADLVIWPEGATRFSPSYSPELIETISSQLGGQAIIFGSPSFEESGDFYNSAHVVDKKGENIYRYDKQHLLPFGEYIPFGKTLGRMGIATETMSRFSMSKGAARPWPESELPSMNILICYEGVFPKYAQRSGEFIVLITNDSWFGNAGGPSQHLDIARFRAIESGKPLVRSAKTGISAFVSAKGELLNTVPLNTKGTITQTVGPRYETTIYSSFGNRPLYVLIFAGLIVATRGAKKRGRARRAAKAAAAQKQT